MAIIYLMDANSLVDICPMKFFFNSILAICKVIYMILFQLSPFSFLQWLQLLLLFIVFYYLIFSIFFKDYLSKYQSLNFINEYVVLMQFFHFAKTQLSLLNLKFVFFNTQLYHINLMDLQKIIYFLIH